MIVADVKPRPDDCNISTQHIAASVLDVWPPSCCDVLRVWCDMSVVVGSNLKIVRRNICGCCMMYVVVLQCYARACALVRFSTRNMPQQDGQTHATCPTMLRYVVSEFCDRLAGACKNWANNVAICCAELLRSFGRGLRMFWGNCGAHPSNIKRKFSTILLAF